jgi:hypothetical protein
MTTPHFRFGGYMRATGGGTNRAASSSYGSRPTSNNNNRSYRSYSGPSEAKTKSQERLSGRIRDVKADEDQGIDVAAIKAANKARNEAAYKASLDKQKEMQKAISLAYNQDGSSNFQNLDDNQKQQLIDSGFAAAESSGVLGGTFGAEIVSNQLKQALADANTYGAQQDAIAALDRLHGSEAVTDAMYEMGLLNPDQSAVYSFGSDIDRYKGGTYLKDAFYDMQSSGLTPENYTNYMNKITAFGHSPQTGFGFGGGGGGGYGYGGGSGGGGGFGYNMNMGMQGQPKQRAQVGPGSLQEQVNQAFLSGGKPFAKGGIVSLVED